MDDLEPRGLPAFVAEFVGTLLLTVFVGLALTAGPAAGQPLGPTAVGLVHLLVLAVVVGTAGAVSGAHVNPVVTVALAALRRIGPLDALTYVVLQLAGAVAGALLVRVLVGDPGEAARYGAPVLAGGTSLAAGFLAELIGAFVLVWAYARLAAERSGLREAAPLVVGGAFGLAALALGPLTGGAVNPARALGPSLVGDGEPADRFAVAYVLGPLAGALLAAAVVRLGVDGPRRALPAGPGNGPGAAVGFGSGPGAGAGTPAGAVAEPVHRPVDRLD
jgi:glycerol uptake facilitator-like aquaporin